jgi:coenzyme F420-reducing hydrogenase delta subunit
VKIHFTCNVEKYNTAELNAMGKAVYTKNIAVVCNNETQAMQVNKSFVAGNYSLLLVAEDGSK